MKKLFYLFTFAIISLFLFSCAKKELTENYRQSQLEKMTYTIASYEFPSEIAVSGMNKLLDHAKNANISPENIVTASFKNLYNEKDFKKAYNLIHLCKKFRKIDFSQKSLSIKKEFEQLKKIFQPACSQLEKAKKHKVLEGMYNKLFNLGLSLDAARIAKYELENSEKTNKAVLKTIKSHISNCWDIKKIIEEFNPPKEEVKTLIKKELEKKHSNYNNFKINKVYPEYLTQNHKKTALANYLKELLNNSDDIDINSLREVVNFMITHKIFPLEFKLFIKAYLIRLLERKEKNEALKLMKKFNIKIQDILDFMKTVPSNFDPVQVLFINYIQNKEKKEKSAKLIKELNKKGSSKKKDPWSEKY